MAKTNLFYGMLLSGTMISGMFGSLAFAADVESRLPAVSAVNGKVEFMGGAADFDALSRDEEFYTGAALSIPLGDAWGLQADVAVVDVFDETTFGGTLHLFTRNPSSYLLGAIGGVVDSGSSNMIWAGGEAELYLDNISFSAVAGLGNVDSNVLGANTGTEFVGDLEISFYATENMRIGVNASSVAGFESGGIDFEWSMQDHLGMPLALTADVSIGEDGYTSATAGLSFYFGGNDPTKSLIRRHREDDPKIKKRITRGVNIHGAGAAPICAIAGEVPVYDPEGNFLYCSSFG